MNVEIQQWDFLQIYDTTEMYRVSEETDAGNPAVNLTTSASVADRMEWM